MLQKVQVRTLESTLRGRGAPSRVPKVRAEGPHPKAPCTFHFWDGPTNYHPNPRTSGQLPAVCERGWHLLSTVYDGQQGKQAKAPDQTALAFDVIKQYPGQVQVQRSVKVNVPGQHFPQHYNWKYPFLRVSTKAVVERYKLNAALSL